MKKKIIPILTVIVLIICAVFVLVKNKDKISETNKEPTKIENTTDNGKNTEKNTEQTEEETGTKEVSENKLPEWTKFKMKLKNKNVTLPMKYKDFENSGYIIADIREGDKFAPLDFVQDIPVKNKEGKTFKINVANETEQDISVYKCYVTGFTISKNDNIKDITLPSNLKIGMTYDEVKKKLGEPLEVWEPNVEYTAVWNINSVYECNMTFDENDKCIEIVMNTKN